MKSNQRKNRFGVLLNWRELQALERLAESEGGASKGATVRKLIREKAQELGFWVAFELPTTQTQKEAEK